MKKRLNRFVSTFLTLAMVLAMIPTLSLKSFAYTDVSSNKPFTFVKTGRVVTLMKDYSDYYIMRETFAADGSYVENVVIQNITKTQYEAELSKKTYDVLKISELTSSIGDKLINAGGGRLYFVNMISGVNGNTTASFIGNISNGYNNNTSMTGIQSEFDNPISFLFNNNGRFFRGTSNTITGITTLVPIEQDTYELLTLSMSLENISYRREVKYWNDTSGKAHFSDCVYTQTGVELVNFVKDAFEIETTIDKVLSGETFKDDTAAGTDEAQDGFQGDRYGEKYQEWADTFNFGFQGTWQDPSFLGHMKLIEWEDPFWTNDDIGDKGSNAIGGYRDDLGNWIATDINGNPIPSIPGQFDSAGNFQPAGLNGYYDPEGVYHPLFSVKNNISSLNNNIYIDDVGYFDRYGTWHEDTKNLGYIYLFDGSTITPNGLLYDKDNKLRDVLVSDMWGMYSYGSWKIYPDGTVFDTALKKIILNNGSSYYDIPTEKKNHYFENGNLIMNDSLAKGIKENDNSLKVSNGSIIYETDIIEYSNGIVYNAGTIVLPSRETITAKFTNGEIDLGQYGKIYSNGHYAEYNDFGDLITDDDRIVFPDGTVMFDNGYIWAPGGYIKASSLDKNLNIITTDGVVYNNKLEKGAYIKDGVFAVGASPEISYYDRLGNQVASDGGVTSDKALGYYDEKGSFTAGNTIFTGGYYTCDGDWVGDDGHLKRANSKFGYYDEKGDYILYENTGKFNKDGIYYKNANHVGFYINSNGNLVSADSSSFIMNMNGTISLSGESSTYDGNGLFKIKKSQGYYDELGRFIISNTNPYISNLGGFYDSNQKFHYESEIYIDNNGNWRLLYNPSLGLKVEKDTIGFNYSKDVFTKDGLIKIDGNIGYYNSTGEFIKSEKNPFLGGFYNNVGTWIDKTYYTDMYGNVCLNNGSYIYNGNYITPSGDIGYFDDTGKFTLNVLNPYEKGFYDASGKFHTENYVYSDYMGIYKGYGEKFMMAPDGVILNYEPASLNIGEYKAIYLGIFANKDGVLGIFNSDGKFVVNKNSYSDGVYLPNGGFVDFNSPTTTIGNLTFNGKNSILVTNDDGSFNLFSYDGYQLKLNFLNGYYQTAEGSSFTGDLKYCTIHNGELTPFETGLVEDGFWANDNYYLDSNNNLGYFEKDGTFYLYKGGFGHYDEAGNFVENLTCPYINGFYTSQKKWVGNSTTVNTGHFNKYGIPRNGSIPYENGYFDYEGTWHEKNQKIYIDVNGNAHILSENAIGYKDVNDYLHLYGVDGYFNADGTYVLDNTIMGYYTKDGELKPGKNQGIEGFYDMNKNWYQFGDSGFYDSDGKYFESITGEIIGFYNAVSEFTEGLNPYLNGYYGFNGEWSNIAEIPISIYYDMLGVKHVGKAPYSKGFYDMNGSWYFTGEKGFYDKNGSFYNILTQEIGYYDKLGIYYEGTNPYQHGYYDPNKNLHLFGQEGMYTSTGTYIDISGKNYYYLNGGIRRDGVNPNDEGFYDVRSNWHPFDKDGYFDKEQVFHEYLLVVSSFKVGSSDYILFEGVFGNSEYVSAQIKNTVQFSISKEGMNTRYLDTGIKVSANAMISYDKATDILHAIAIYNKGIFIEDNDACMLVYDGSIINLENTGKISIKKLKDKFVDANIEIVVSKSRVGERYSLVDAIEIGKTLNVYNGKDKLNLVYPLVVQNGIPYIAINDIKNLLQYDVKATDIENGTLLVFTLKDNKLRSGQWYDTITTVVNGYEITSTMGESVLTTVTEQPFTSIKLENYTSNILYMPFSYIGMVTGKAVELDTLNYNIMLYDESTTPLDDSY